jgi:N-ethylmaleimide reductase
MTTAFDPIDLAGLRLANRIAMAPMTRNRAYGAGLCPTPAMAAYYRQRATAGLIITEAIQPSAGSQGYLNTPGLHAPAQVQGWRVVTSAVHEAGGIIFAQLMHAGRVSHPMTLPDGLIPVGPSAVRPSGQVFTEGGLRDFVTPVEMTEELILAAVSDFADAAANAIEAGFDGVEVHGAKGYLVHQFLSSNANRRTDGWGGSTQGRIRFAAEVVRAVAARIGASLTGLRISPGNTVNDIAEDNVRETYPALVDAINPLGLAYLHIAEDRDRDLTLELRRRFRGPLILNPFTGERPVGPAELPLIEAGAADILAFGRLFAANPDLPARLAAGGPFNTPDRATFYGGDVKGYTDYPALGSTLPSRMVV